ncbi:Short-chain dehydrogenase [Fontimonas thermophila]|uniref:Short-chain dehydrogenase n=1 Tax=Fontimonas thermophila TaxID=1076937 RepID=A0A1I2H654_9GAMM|nr:SDR family oxidoreductase [Fontimonas thermophila]SFF25162.1 Short-chain dehydrogenase [Fontimonas thermophila]
MPSTRPVVLITGCSSGIGRALAQAFHARNWQVYATARNREALQPLAAQGMHIAALDVTDGASIASLVRLLEQQGVAVDMLINNAGYGQMGPLAELDEEALRAQFETNVIGLMAVTRALLPGMIARRRGCIVNIGSVSGILVTPFAGAYCASKAAVHALSAALRMELAPFGIRVVTVQPGAIRSEFGANATRVLPESISKASIYAPVADAIAARANASQQHATPAEVFAQQLVAALLRDPPPAVLRIGRGSHLLPALARWLPRTLRDRLLARRFHLPRLRTPEAGPARG